MLKARLHLSRLLYFGPLLFLASPFSVPLYALPGQSVPDAETCHSILLSLRNPNMEALEAATQFLLPARETHEAIKRLELRFRRNLTTREETFRIFAALLRKTVKHAQLDLPQARDVTAAVLLGSMSVEQIEKVLHQLRSPSGWDNPELISHLDIAARDPVRLRPTPDPNAP